MDALPAALKLVTSLLVLVPLAAAQAVPFEVGKPLPALRLPTVDGSAAEPRAVHLRSFVGTKTLLVEFASW
jgi:hypothetical protein